MNRFLCFISVFLLLSCSSEKPSQLDAQKPSETVGRNGVQESSKQPVPLGGEPYSMEIVPSDANRNSTLSLRPKGFNLSDAKIEWLVNGKATSSPVPSQFRPKEAKKGDKVQARAILQDREVFSNIIQIKNNPPVLIKVKVMPEAFKPGDTLYVDVSGSDIDGDEVKILYEWTKNGMPAGNDKRIDGQIKRGDKVSVKITPFDGEVNGRTIILHREIGNLPPMIIENKEFNFDGKVYTYQIKAEDPDGDSLSFSLKSSPSGMVIDPTTGLIHWNVPSGFRGKSIITVSVTDGHGGESVQSLTFEITPEQKMGK